MSWSRLHAAWLPLIVSMVGCADGPQVPRPPDDRGSLAFEAVSAPELGPEGLAVRIVTGATPVAGGARGVEFGRAFPLQVVRAWSPELRPDAWRETELAPLTVQQVAVERIEEPARVVETRRFAAYAFEVGELTVPALQLKAAARDGGEVRTRSADGLELLVVSALGADASPGPELPAGPRRPPPSQRVWWGSGLLAVGMLALCLAYVRWRARRGDGAVIPSVGPHERALERLHALRASAPSGRPAVRADAVEASSLVRDYVGERFGVAATPRTTDEFVREMRGAAATNAEAVAARHREMIAAFLAHCDGVKFASRAPDATDREAWLGAVEEFIADTSPAPREENGAP